MSEYGYLVVSIAVLVQSICLLTLTYSHYKQRGESRENLKNIVNMYQITGQRIRSLQPKNPIQDDR